MKIGILGSGVVGQTLAKGFLSQGHEVQLGTSNPSKLSEWLNGDGKGIEVLGFGEVSANAELLVLAVKGHAAKTVLENVGAEALKGKTIIDATNPIDDSVAPENGVLTFFTKGKSLMEELQEAFPQAHFVKAYNSVGAGLMVNPQLGSKPTMFIAGNNTEAKIQVTAINEAFGWETEDMGVATAARAIEPLCILWCIPGFLKNDCAHAFKLLK